MAIHNDNSISLQGFDPGAVQWAAAQGIDLIQPAAVSIQDTTTLLPQSAGETFLSFKHPAPGVVLSDDDAIQTAIAKLGAVGGTLIIDPGVSINLTRSVIIPDSVQIIGSASDGSQITGSMIGPMFDMTATGKVLLQGLNIVDNGPSGSIVVMSGDNTVLRDCQFANAAGNSSSMVQFGGYNEVVQNCTFSNYDADAFSWEASYTQWLGTNTNINDSVMGGSAFGVGKGGLIHSTGGHYVEGFSIDGFNCATLGTQIQANDIYSLYIRGGVYSGAADKAIVLGGGIQQVTGVDIEGAYISAAGTAIDAAPSGGSGVNDLTIQDCTIGGSGTGVLGNNYMGELSLLHNHFTSDSKAIDLRDAGGGTLAIGNIIDRGAISIVDTSTSTNQVWVGNTLNGSLTITQSAVSDVVISGNQGSASLVDSKGVLLQNDPTELTSSLLPAVAAVSNDLLVPAFYVGASSPSSDAFVPAVVGQTFEDFKHPTEGVTLTDDQAFAAAIAALGPVHGTLVINDGITISINGIVDVPYSMAIVSAGSGLDGSSLITTAGSGPILRVHASGSVVIQGLNFLSGSSGSIVETGEGNTVLRDCQFTNIVGNSAPILLLQGSNQLVQDCFFKNNESSAYSWSASYDNATTQGDSTTVSGGWAYGIGKGGLIGGSGSGHVNGFNIRHFTDVTTGATQVETGDVGTLDVEGGVYDYSSEAAFSLGVGGARTQSVNIASSYISTASNQTDGIAVDAGPPGGGGVSNLTVRDNQINFAGVGIRADAETGNLTAVGNDFRYNQLGFSITDPTGTIMVVGNQLNGPDALFIKQGPGGSAQTYLGNSLNGTLSVEQFNSPALTFIYNTGSAVYADSSNVPLQPDAVTATTSSSQIAAMSLKVVVGLTSRQLQSLTEAQISAITSTQEAVLTPSQIGSLTPGQVSSLTVVQVSGLTPAQIAALSATSISALSLSQLAVLSSAQVGALSVEQFAVLAPDTLSTLTAAQLSDVADSIMRSLTMAQLSVVQAKLPAPSEVPADAAPASGSENATGGSAIHQISPPAVSGATKPAALVPALPGANPAPGTTDPAVPQVAPAARSNPLETFTPAAALSGSTDTVEATAEPGNNASASSPAASADPLFDASFYLSHYSDVAAAEVDPYTHFTTYGWTEGRNPSALFDTNYYLTENPGERSSGGNPLTDYETVGWREGRDPSPSFSGSGYLEAYRDVAAAGVDPLQHFIEYGRSEGRLSFVVDTKLPTDPLVNAAYYEHQVGAILSTSGSNAAKQATSDYDQVGWQQGLNPNAFFDTNYYLSHNPDVAAAHVNPLLHYEDFGWKEGRDPSAAFSTVKYLAAYQDVAAAHLNPLEHFLTGNPLGVYHAFSV